MLEQRKGKLWLVAAALAALVPVGAHGALADRSYGDPSGDSGSAPDITNVAASDDDATGVVTFAVTTNKPTLVPEESFWGYIDTDMNASTGLSIQGIGAEHMFLVDEDGGFMAHVVGNTILFDFDTTLSSNYASGVLTVRIARSELGSMEQFAFGFESELDDANGDTIASDRAPDSPPYYVYSFLPLTVSVGTPLGTPAKPVAGRSFAVSVPLARSDEQPITAAQVTCQARAGKQTLRTVGSLAGSSARCTMRIPKGAKTKVLRGSVSVVIDGAPAKKSFAFPIR